MKMELEEKWKPVVGYEGLYEVSNLGRVRSLNYNRTGKSKVLKFVKHRGGYLQVGLCKNGKKKRMYIHRIVAEAFIPKVEGKEFVDHINGCGTDNIVENLRWCTNKENINFPLAKKNKSKAMKIAWSKPETKEKQSKAQKIAWSKSEIKEKVCKPVLQFTKTGEFVAEYYGGIEAERQTGVNNSLISLCCNGKLKTSGGYVWKFKEVG